MGVGAVVADEGWSHLDELIINLRLDSKGSEMRFSLSVSFCQNFVKPITVEFNPALLDQICLQLDLIAYIDDRPEFNTGTGLLQAHCVMLPVESA